MYFIILLIQKIKYFLLTTKRKGETENHEIYIIHINFFSLHVLLHIYHPDLLKILYLYQFSFLTRKGETENHEI